MRNRTLRRETFALLIALACIRGMNFTAIKISLSGLTPLIASGWRNALAGSALLSYALALRRPLWPSSRARLKLLGMGALFTLNFFLVYTAMNTTTASRASILLNSQPLAVALLSRYLIPSDRVTRQKVVGLALAFVGVSVVLSDRGSSLHFATLRGDLLALLAAFNWAILVILRKQVAQEVDPGVVAAWEVLIGAFTLTPLGMTVDADRPLQLSFPVVAALLYSGLLGGALVFGVNVYLIKHYDVNAVSSFNFLIPVVGTLVGILFLRDPFTFQILIGVVLVATGIAIVNRPMSSNKRNLG